MSTGRPDRRSRTRVPRELKVLCLSLFPQGDPWHFTPFVLITIFFGVSSVTVIAALPLYLLVRPTTPLSSST